jgi:hypothetical protein
MNHFYTPKQKPSLNMNIIWEHLTNNFIEQIIKYLEALVCKVKMVVNYKTLVE